MRIRIKLIRDQAGDWRADLPTYAMIPGSWLPIVAGVITADGVVPGAVLTPAQRAQLSCEVEIPDEYANEAGTAINVAKLRALHRGHPRWSDPGKPPDV